MSNLYKIQQNKHFTEPNTIPDQIRLELSFAESYVENNDYDEAIVSYKKIITLNLKNNTSHRNIGFYNRLGNLYQSQGRLSDAIDAYTNAIDISKQLPSDAVNQGVYISRIKCLLESSLPENLNLVINDCNSLIEINKNNGYPNKNIAVYVDLAKAYFKLNQIESAENSYKEAISLAHGEKAISIYVALGKLYELNDNHDAAIDCYTHAIEYSPSFGKAIAPHIRLANVYRQQGKLYEAEDIYKKVISSAIPDKMKLGAYNNLGKLYEALRRYKDALDCYESAIHTAPEDTVGYINAVLLLDKLGEIKKADAYFKFLTQKGDNIIEYLRDTHRALNIAEAEKLSYLGSMATGIAHNINNPTNTISLTALRGLRQVKKNSLNNQEAQDIFEGIMHEVKRLTNIVKQFQEFSKGDRNKRERVNLNEVVKKVAAYFDGQFQGHDITLNLDLSNNNPQAYANQFVVQEVLINLITNAREEVEKIPNAIVWVKTWKTPKHSIIQVEDNGTGVPEAQQKDLFSPFHSTKANGMGLGLHFAKSALERINSTIAYQNRPEGGACFTVYLPQ